MIVTNDCSIMTVGAGRELDIGLDRIAGFAIAQNLKPQKSLKTPKCVYLYCCNCPNWKKSEE